MEVAAAFKSGACCGGGGTITSVIPATHQAKAAYRLLDNKTVTHQAVIQTHCAHVRSMLDEPGVTLLIEDTTAIAHPNLKESSGLGPIGEGFTRGYWLHTTLAVRFEPSAEAAKACHLRPLGLAHQHAWARPEVRPGRPKSTGRGKESNHARQKREDRESVRWAACLSALPVRKNPDATLIYIADRESDIYEVFEKCLEAGVSFVIRAAYPRALATGGSAAKPAGKSNGKPTAEPVPDLMATADHAPVRGVIELDLPQRNGTVKLEVRSTTMELRGPRRPGGRLANLTLGVVRVREINPPEGVEPLEWTLLTDLPVDTLEACVRVTRIYRARWTIEEFHKGLKTGLGLELSQLSDYRRLSALAGIVSVVAVFMLLMKWSARAGEKPLEPELKQDPMTRVLEKIYPPSGGLTNRWLWISIARLGGFQARKTDGPPGWLTLWRGWQTLQLLLRGYQLAGP